MGVLEAATPNLSIIRLAADKYNLSIEVNATHYATLTISKILFFEQNYNITIVDTTCQTSYWNASHSASACVANVLWNLNNIRPRIQAEFQYTLANDVSIWTTFSNIGLIHDYTPARGISCYLLKYCGIKI